MQKADISCELLGLRMRNPIVLASGIIGTTPTLLKRAAQSGAGAVTAKSCGPLPRAGHPNPVVLDWGAGVINAIGLTNPGAQEELGVLIDTRRALAPLGVPLIASLFAGRVEEFGQVASILVEAQPDMLEVDISCPNVGSEFGMPFAASADTAAAVTEAVKRVAGDIPVIIKLGPNVPNIGYIAGVVVEAGADAITAVNAMPGMIIDPESGKAVLANKAGGVSGRALKPIALRCVYEIASKVSVPIIGTGGVLSGVDAAEMLMAGATAVGVGTAVWYRGVSALGEIADELQEFLTSRGHANLAAIRGSALR